MSNNHKQFANRISGHSATLTQTCLPLWAVYGSTYEADEYTSSTLKKKKIYLKKSENCVFKSRTSYLNLDFKDSKSFPALGCGFFSSFFFISDCCAKWKVTASVSTNCSCSCADRLFRVKLQPFQTNSWELQEANNDNGGYSHGSNQSWCGVSARLNSTFNEHSADTDSCGRQNTHTQTHTYMQSQLLELGWKQAFLPLCLCTDGPLLISDIDYPSLPHRKR